MYAKMIYNQKTTETPNQKKNGICTAAGRLLVGHGQDLASEFLRFFLSHPATIWDAGTPR